MGQLKLGSYLCTYRQNTAEIPTFVWVKVQISTVCTPPNISKYRYGHKYWNRKAFEKIGVHIKKAAPTGEDRGRYSEYLDLLRYALSDISPKHINLIT